MEEDWRASREEVEPVMFLRPRAQCEDVNTHFFGRRTIRASRRPRIALTTPNQVTMKLIPTLLAVFVSSIVTTSFGKPHEHDDYANRFDWVNLVSDISGVARHTDENLVNPWGLVISPTGVFWVANADSGVATVYNSHGRPLPNETHPLVVTIPTADGTYGIE